MKIGILQQNFVVGDYTGNAARIIDGYQKLCKDGAEIIVSTELGIFGYPPKDLLDRPDEIRSQLKAFELVADHVSNIPLVAGLAEFDENHSGKSILNTAVIIQNGLCLGKKVKELLPTYDVFDESRYFKSGPKKPCIVEYDGKRIGLLVCEDSWSETRNLFRRPLYESDPVLGLQDKGLDLLIIINASPYYWGKRTVRHEVFSRVARRVDCPVVYTNQVGGNDDLIFDGGSFIIEQHGICRGMCPPFEECETIFDTESNERYIYPFDKEREEDLYNALVLGVRDYMRKTGFTKVVIAESGGIDSALTTCIAVDAIGKENVTAIGMPSPFSSEGSVEDARKLCGNLGVKFELIPIDSLYHIFGSTVKDVVGWKEPKNFGKDVTEENVQARLRGAIVMAYSNRTGALVLSTGNKSELAVGYCTLYGDMVGGLAVLSDVPKTFVYRLAEYVNKKRWYLIPRDIIEKPPSAELRPDQKDRDSLPPYDILDDIIHLYVEENWSLNDILKERRHPSDTVTDVIGKINRNEYKRQQGALGLKVTSKAFGSGRRMPIATKPREIMALV